MKRTIKPFKRQNIKKQDVNLDIKKEDGNKLFVYIQIKNLKDYDFPKKSKIFLEAYNKMDIDHIDLGMVNSIKLETIKKPLPSFDVSQRSKIKFRLKVSDPKTWYLLGLAEKLKEKKYAKSFFNFETDNSINTVFKIDWGDSDYPILHFNQDLMECRQMIKPLLAEAVFKEILQTLLLSEDFLDKENLENHQWIEFAKKIQACRYFGDGWF